MVLDQRYQRQGRSARIHCLNTSQNHKYGAGLIADPHTLVVSLPTLHSFSLIFLPPCFCEAMRFFILTTLLCISSGLALPYPMQNQHALRSVPKRALEKRDAVCGADFRSLVSSDSCAGKSPAFVLATPNAAVVTAQAQPPVSPVCLMPAVYR